MAQYKVLQDIEAEDKLLGPLSLRQFIYAIITIALGFVAFRLIAAGVWYLAIPFIPPAIFFALLAAPLGREQSSEIWLLAKIRFIVKPKKRVWDQEGMEELVTITAPKKVEPHLTKGYSKDEVSSRLKALAATLDTRGWAVKNAPNMYNTQGGSDRLVDIAQPNPAVAVNTPDPLDLMESPAAHKMDQMLASAEMAHKQELMEKIQEEQTAEPPVSSTTATPPSFTQQSAAPKYPTLNQAAVAAVPTPPAPPTPAISTLDEQALLNKIHKQDADAHLANAHLKTLQPRGKTTAPKQPKNSKAQAVTTPVNPDILSFVHNDDLNVATISRQVNKKPEQDTDNEVVISLR